MPTPLRRRLLERYSELKSAWLKGEYDACGLRAGRASEILLRVLQHELEGTHTPLGDKLPTFADECRRLERLPKSSGVESLRVVMPRALNFLYTLRNKRGIGHEGGDVDANEIDAAIAVRLADWCIAELVRVVHQLSLEEAQALLDAIAEREIPQVWAVGGKKRVLDAGLPRTSQVLLLLYSEPDTAIPVEDLCAWVEHPKLPYFVRDVLRPLHRDRLIEHDSDSATVVISPRGANRVEEELVRPKPAA